MPPFNLRDATQNDTRAIRALIREVHINPIGLDWRRFVLATTSVEGVIGCGQVKVHRDGTYELASIAVLPEWRQRGVASAIIDHLIAIHNKILFLTCRASLRDFYEKFGFRVVQNQAEMPPYFRRASRAFNLLKSLRLVKEDLLVMQRGQTVESQPAAEGPQ